MKKRIVLTIDIPTDVPEEDQEQLRSDLQEFGSFLASRVIRKTHKNFSWSSNADIRGFVEDRAPRTIDHSEGVIGE